MATIISNQASATYTFDGSTQILTTSSNIANTTLLDDYSIDISTIIYQTSFSPGENITYSLLIKNTGTKEINNLNISIDLGNYVSYLDSSSRLFINDSVVQITPTNQEPLTYNITNTILPNGSILLTYIATVDENIPITFNNVLNRTTFTINDGSTYTSETNIPRLLSANITINKDVSKSQITSTDNYSYTLLVTNSGLADAKNLVITDNLPTGFSVNSITINDQYGTRSFDTTDYSIYQNVLTLPVNPAVLDIPAQSQSLITINGSFFAE